MERELSLVQTSAGGGTRARPLSLYSATTMIPKGMMRVMGLPISEVQMEQAKRWGIEKAYIVAKDLENRDQLATRFSDGKDRFGIRIRYSHPLDDFTNKGSGDALLTNIFRNNLPGDSLVLSNDNLFEFDLDQALQRHRDNNAVVTVLTIPMKPRDTINTYGLIDVDENGRVKKLVEKPKNEEEVMKALGFQSVSELNDRRVHVNTAGYILNNRKLEELAQTEQWIIEGRKNLKNFDMAGNLLAGLVDRGFPIYVKSIEEWGDFGTLPNYLETTKRALGGAFRSIDEILKERGYRNLQGNSWIHAETLDAKSRLGGRTLREKLNSGALKIGPNVFIGRDCELGDGCIIKYSDLEKQTTIGANAHVDNSVLFPYSIVGENATLDRALLALQSYVESSVSNPTKITDGSTIGPQVIIPAGSNLRNTIVFPGYTFSGPETRVNETIEPSAEQLVRLQDRFGSA